MKPDDAVEEGAGYRRRGVGVAERNEVCVLSEAADDGENDRLAADLRQPFNEIHGDIRPYLGRYLQRLKQTGGLQGCSLVALASSASTHPILDHRPITWNIKVQAKAVQCLLDPFMAGTMGELNGLVPEITRVRHKYTCAMQQETTVHVPGSA